MMKTKFLLLSALVALTLSACQKDNVGLLRLYIEGMGSDSKMAAEGGASYWATGDLVRINNELVTVGIDESAGTATAVSSGEGFQAPYFGVYPAAIYASNSGDSYTLNLPPCYTYTTTTHFGSTMQNLGTPMVAYSASGTELLFKHVTAALNVKVVNDFGVDVRVTDITISSNKYQLSGATTLTVGGDINVDPVSAEGDGNAALRQVQMTFGGTQLIVPCGGTAVVQVPVLPVGDDNRFTISVTVQNKDDADMSWTFSKTQAGNSSDGYALGRAMVGYAPAKFGGVFTVAAGMQVRFAPGNLQYQASSGTWRFAKHQYDAIGNVPGTSEFDSTARSTSSDWIDLFCWGTSGQDHGNARYMAYLIRYFTSSRCYEYGPGSGYQNLTIANKGDWGVNAISNGGNDSGVWRTLTKDQMTYLFSTRVGATIGETANGRYAKAKVCNVQGLILFPDDYVHPNGVDNPKGVNETGSTGWYGNNYDAASWNKMEVAGAVFMPVTGRLESTSTTTSYQSAAQGYYWTATYTSNKAYAINYGSVSLSTGTGVNRYYNLAVRLVRDVK